MNEVARIHLGRQPFIISVEAHRILKAYIAAIQKQVRDQDVVDEIELRMAELLIERGIKGEKVILETDVEFLKQQLGTPVDFKEDTGDSSAEYDDTASTKQLFRDTDNALLAGVASGLANYLGIDVLLVRIIFVIATLSGGWGILVYIAIWLLVPPVKSPSDRLRMQGKPVTVESLKRAAERADVKGAAVRANNTIAPVINRLFAILLKIAGVGLIIAGLTFIFGLIATTGYMALHNGQLFQDSMFPVGATEHLLANLALALAGLLSVFVILSGLAIFKRRWPIRGWITGILIGLFFIGLAGSIALTADAAPKVRDRYDANSKTVIRAVEPFQNVNIQSEDLDYRYEYAQNYSVSFHYLDNPDISKIKTTVKNGVLVIDTRDFNLQKDCTMLCLFPRYNLTVTVYGPNIPEQGPWGTRAGQLRILPQRHIGL
jgi:phage shock protein PspC (stress-responsive transcriptional regulator)